MPAKLDRDLPLEEADTSPEGLTIREFDTVVSSAIPRKAARCIIGCKPDVFRISPPSHPCATDLVTKMAPDEASPCTRAAMFTVCPK